MPPKLRHDFFVDAHADFPVFTRISEKKHVFFSHFRQSYVCGKKMLSPESVGLPEKQGIANMLQKGESLS